MRSRELPQHGFSNLAGYLRVNLTPSFHSCGESALLADFAHLPIPGVSLFTLTIAKRLEASQISGLHECIPALSSLTVIFDPFKLELQDLEHRILALANSPPEGMPAGRTWQLPVVYGGRKGPDLAEIAQKAGVGESDVIEIHSSVPYRVEMLGFLPGFAYLSGLPEVLRVPRLSQPRARVPEGAVAVASDMTSIYPLESPGGWRLLGWTPVRVWDMSRFDTPLLLPGDQVHFKPASEQEAAQVAEAAAQGWRPEPADSR